MKNKTCITSGLSAEGDFTSASAYPIAGGMWGGGGDVGAERDRDDGVTGKELSLSLSL